MSKQGVVVRGYNGSPEKTEAEGGKVPTLDYRAKGDSWRGRKETCHLTSLGQQHTSTWEFLRPKHGRSIK